MRTVVFVAPFPAETTMRFAHALASLDGVRLVGLFQQPPTGAAARTFDALVQVADALDTKQLIAAVDRIRRAYGGVHRVVGVLENLQVQVAEVRAHFGIFGPSPESAKRFRDKALMKDHLRNHGVPVAAHKLLTSVKDAEAFVAKVGFPVVLKPPDGAGCKATYRCNDPESLARALVESRPSPTRPVLAEEFLRGVEHSFETLTLGGTPVWHSISRYHPTPLEVMENDWMQWTVHLPRDIRVPEFNKAREVGVAAVRTLGLTDGMTHMEWFRRPNGSVAVGEIAMRPPGAHLVRLMSLAYDADLYRAWARAVVDSAFDGPWERKYSVGCAYLRGPGKGRVANVTGVQRMQALVGDMVVEARLPRVGAPRAESYEGDGHIILRHPDSARVARALKAVIETIQVRYA